MRTSVLSLAVLVASAAVSVGDDEVPARTAGEFYPTAVGTQWVMVTDYEDGTESYVDDIRIVEEKIVNGYRKWRIRTTSRVKEQNPLKAIASAFVPANPEDVFEGWEFYDVGREAYVVKDLGEEFEGDPAYPLLYYPVRPQQVFEDPDGIVTTVLDVDRKVKVPAGEFRCIVYEVDYDGEGRTKVAANPPAAPRLQFTSTGDEEAADTAPAFPGAEEAPAAPEEEEYAESTIVVEYWSKGVGLVMTEEFTIEDDGSRTLYSTQRLVSFNTPRRPAAGEKPTKSE